MTMLLHDEGSGPEGLCARSNASSSPHLGTAALLSRQKGGGGGGGAGAGAGAMAQSHALQYGGAGDVSPTTACFSVASGSPASLRLQPEHEVLLADMQSLDLHAPAGEDAHEYWTHHGLS
ncbi:uncharacterized protein PHACADRAFT_261589 [Phanerochaete carnosa HHB-10118-sp]|uniref:Uncharacterized protein n=1 Tax=Phanerochaete carnosa (strain HHB-10118-sp) TaxID=650164 RepID=K5USL3_PHACS|nr:uncharacterized protein PHACADRAFT_261589 [Phanerochaete carnosa HHB-10118-sp]EKM52901.1 hypothetical protein PHACADRAFT_261589 [Phanerochaete carnosa HHB-10118-sp]